MNSVLDHGCEFTGRVRLSWSERIDVLPEGEWMAQAVSGVIVVFLLGLYAHAVSILVKDPVQDPVSQVRTILTVVGGLVSALIVAVLAATPPKAPLGRVFVERESRLMTPVTVVTWAYVFVWLACGGVLLYCWLTPAACLPPGELQKLAGTIPAPSKTLDTAATSWLGLAVAAAYAYLGLKKDGRAAGE